MYKLRIIARRGTMFAGAGALLFASLASGTSAFADSLNPLTHRSLSLSSSSPGWSFTDGSGNSTYAVPNSGANGKQAGNTFSFNVSTDSSSSNTVKALTFQYCTKSAGNCYAPGNDGFVSGNTGARNPDSAANRTSDLNIITASPSEVGATKFGTMIDTSSGNINTSNASNSPYIPKADNSEGNYVVMTKDAGASVWSRNSGWAMTSVNAESATDNVTYPTGANNQIVLKNTSGGLALHPGGAVKIIFFGTNTNYITNPGQGSFFVKINDFKSATTQDATTLLDGGVTVANVMNQSIQITTKVLETMEFSVGTVDPYTLDSSNGTSNTLSDLEVALGTPAPGAGVGDSNAYKHLPCSRILTGINAANPAAQNVLQMGDTGAENSLATAHTYSTHSFWRLSSNSSAGATVYYSGVTLSNTVGDKIAAIGPTKTVPTPGAEQFGLALTNGTIGANPQPLSTNPGSVFAVNYGTESTAGTGMFENGADLGKSTLHASTTADVGGNASYHAPRLYPMIPFTDGAGGSNYDQGAGNVNTEYAAANSGTVDTKFAFDTSSNTVPTPIASESNQVVDCVTGRMRYIANIAGTTPAGIYTTKINYIAAPQY